ncbi:carboxypeptidase regulatory-like domain-containing protein [Bifidobacterium sp. 82T10]|uniref:Carboxypeptidase regulatory-like domain-containing protein n=1 Tax=Bifidobacterium miconis TaxID=2834435 RepID=A0ABS6WDH3_9BIFI|nr:carboxypeptidase regulatory-like domain-containing protein [Bifidobacterium miconis]
MTAATIRCRRHRSVLPPLTALATALIAILMTLTISQPTPAIAAESVATCNPTAQNGCVNGILQDASKKPIAGVTVTLSGAESATTQTDANGKWAFSVTADGTYTVTIDESVAKEHGLGTNTADVEIVKNSFDKQRGVVRFDQSAGSTGGSSGSSNGSSGTSSGSSTGDDGGTAGTNGTSGARGSSSANDAAAATDKLSATLANIGARFWQQLYSGVIFGLMLGLMSVGMNLVYGTTRLSSFSHGEQVTLGGLMAYVGTQLLHWPLVVSAVFAVAVGALTGWIQNELVWAPLRRKHVGPMQQMIVTIGLSMALQYLFQFFFGGDIKGITKSVPDSFALGPITTDAPTLVSAGLAIVVIVGITLFLYKTRLGRATRAVSDNAALAAASGINVEQVVRIVWILSCAMAALSGVLLGIYLNGISWNTGATLLLLMFAAVTLGGLGTANGALVGSLIIGIVADMSSLVIPNDMRYASALAILIIVLLVRPQGIFGKAQRVG